MISFSLLVCTSNAHLGTDEKSPDSQTLISSLCAIDEGTNCKQHKFHPCLLTHGTSCHIDIYCMTYKSSAMMLMTAVEMFALSN